MAPSEQERIPQGGLTGIWLLHMAAASMLVLVVFLLYDYRKHDLTLDHHLQAQQQELAESADRLSQRIFAASQELELLSHLAVAESLLSNGHAQPNKVVSVFRRVMEIHPEFQQLRLLDAGGQERLRINRHKDGLILVDPAELQFKGHRDYVRQAFTVGREEVYLSGFDLNSENGQIELPPRPTLRLLQQVHGLDGHILGLAAINLDAAALLADLEASFAAPFTAVATQTDGSVLTGPPQMPRWARQLGHGQTLSIAAPEIWQSLQRTADGEHVLSQNLWLARKDVYATEIAANIQAEQSPLAQLVLTAPREALGWSVWQGLGNQAQNIAVMLFLAALVCTFTTAQTRLLHQRNRQRDRDMHRLHLAGVVHDNTSEALVVTDADRRILSVNPAFTELLGYPAEEVLGLRPSCWSSGQHDQAFYQAMWDTLERDGQWQGEIINRAKTGSLVTFWENISVVRDNAGRVTHYVSILGDISKLKQVEANLEHLAYHDSLTELPNRRLLELKIDELAQQDTPFALALMDLDGFKVINDSLGHAMGDELLQEIARRLTRAVRPHDLVARIGGDEFALLLPRATHQTTSELLTQVLREINVAVQIQAHQIHPLASAGIAMAPDDGRDNQALIRAADAAMYDAKHNQKHGFRFHSAELSARAQQRMDSEHALRQALRDRQLRLHYQPQMDLRSRRVVGAEALLRWEHPQRGLISAGEFIPVAEESGLIEELGAWVIATAAQQARSWLDQGLNQLRLAVNLSGHQFGYSNVQELVYEQIRTHRLDRSGIALELEMTESMLMQDPGAIAVLEEFRAHGIGIALDDFGTGYSSLAQLRQLPVDRLKIAGVFVRSIEEEPSNMAIVRTIVRLAREMKMTVLAEEVETESQLRLLQEAGCDEIQGYWLAPAISAEDFAQLVRKHNAQRKAG